METKLTRKQPPGRGKECKAMKHRMTTAISIALVVSFALGLSLAETALVVFIGRGAAYLLEYQDK